ncbi:hypothetical protein Dimus_028599 [Dionaea muscipula]
MVKFSKELKAQLIPEWKEAFVDYWQLKKHIKRIRLTRKSSNPYSRPQFDPCSTIFSYFPKCVPSSKLHNPPNSSSIDQEICSKPTVRVEDDEGDDVDTELFQLFSEEDEVKKFLERLEGEVEKVNGFYKIKENEFGERGEALTKQLHILLQLKQLNLDHRRRHGHRARPSLPPPINKSCDVAAASLCPSNSSSVCFSNFSAGNSLSSSSPPSGCQEPAAAADSSSELLVALQKINGVNVIRSVVQTKLATKLGKPKMAMRIDVADMAMAPATWSASSAMSGLWEDLLNSSPRPTKDGGAGDFLSRKKIQCAEKMIRGAFMEFYRGLNLLNTYRSLNMVAFTKILKKFDKVANRQMSAEYLKLVKGTHFVTSDKVMRLMDEVETMFTKHFTGNDRKMAMKFLRPQQQKDSHLVTFFLGLFTGCFVTLFILYGILAHLCGIFSPRGPADYMETVYPVFSMFALMSLHLFMYGCNLITWKAARINYNFIFEFSPKTSLKSRDAFLICTSFMTAVIAAMLIHLILKSNGFSPSQVDALLAILLLICIVLLVCPFNILYHPTRYFFLRVTRNIVCSPFYKVVMVDFFMADQFTSQIPLLRYMETTACHFLAGSFTTHRYQACKSGTLYRQLAYLVSFAPYYWRAMQCARRWFDESDPNHLANLGKYVSAMVAAGARLTYTQQPTQLGMIIVLFTSVAATVYQLYWDFVKDWGLLNPNSKNPWLRDDLILRNKCIYYISIAVNVVLRVAWVETVLRFNIGIFESRLLEFSLASLEVIRRGHWNFYRLENEHLNNVGKFRAVKMVPLPFSEMDSDG